MWLWKENMETIEVDGVITRIHSRKPITNAAPSKRGRKLICNSCGAAYTVEFKNRFKSFDFDYYPDYDYDDFDSPEETLYIENYDKLLDTILLKDENSDTIKPQKSNTESEYYTKKIICRKCAEKKGKTLFDLNHPIINYLNQKKKFDKAKLKCFRSTTGRFFNILNKNVLDKLNHDAFEEARKFGNLKSPAIARDAAIFYRIKTKSQLKDYICKEFAQNNSFKKAKAELTKARERLIQYLDGCGEVIEGIPSYAVSNKSPSEYESYPWSPDDIFPIFEKAKYSKTELLEQISNEAVDIISTPMYDEFYRNFLEAAVRVFNSTK